ncbi:MULTISPECIES: hypothetical protein [Streptacidiphilus]|uniref:Uncharacterized protein n=1 Tax=Streptacidiphilus cavernicola TaxID=3342716 RepID=A0ABV6ULU3_9ACTN|nr:hypothetical protein [Streptacidiphilus jeojiense]
MTGATWTPPPDFDYALRQADPQPVAGCDDCERLAQRRSAARSAGDGSAATDANVLLRQHLQQDHP